MAIDGLAPYLRRFGAIGFVLGGAMPSDGRGAVDFVADAIRAYISAHPGAADNAAGIQKWWLPPDLANGPTADVEAALAVLHVAGVLSELRLPDGNVVYSAAQRPGKLT